MFGTPICEFETRQSADDAGCFDGDNLVRIAKHALKLQNQSLQMPALRMLGQ
jgi:hypothetical protein